MILPGWSPLDPADDPVQRTSMLSRSAIFCCHAVLLLALAGTALSAEQVSFTTVEGRVFNDVTVTRTSGRKLEVMTATGAQLIRFNSLPREIQERFFDPSMRFPPKVGDDLEFKALDGRAFKGPLREIAPNGITLETPDGLEKLAYSNLPAELANTFDYDAEDAARYEAALRAQKQRVFAAQREAEKKAAAQRAAAEKAAARSKSHRKASGTETPAMGDRGTQNLGAPKLGGRGLDK
jgi:hypothetical protein